MADTPVKVNNMDIAGIYNRLQSFMRQIALSTSADGTQTSAYDQDRLSSYLVAVIGYVDYVVGSPLLDLPMVAPRSFPMEAIYIPPDATNDELNDVLRLLAAGRDELISSASAAEITGLQKFDEIRFRAVLGKAQSFVANYIAKLTPIDTPETSVEPQRKPRLAQASRHGSS